MPSISDLLSEDPSPGERERDPSVVGIADDVADDVFPVLSSGTAREILDALYDEPRTASAVAEATGTTLQNAIHHLDNLQEAGLIEVVDTLYSDQGKRMKVYAPTDGGLVVVAGVEPSEPSVVDALKRALGGIAVVAMLGLVLGWTRWGGDPPREGAPIGEGAGQWAVGLGVVEAVLFVGVTGVVLGTVLWWHVRAGAELTGLPK